MEGPYKVLVMTMWFINLKSAVLSVPCFLSPKKQ